MCSVDYLLGRTEERYLTGQQNRVLCEIDGEPLLAGDLINIISNLDRAEIEFILSFLKLPPSQKERAISLLKIMAEPEKQAIRRLRIPQKGRGHASAPA